jgi:hypothetical protein
MRSGGRPAIGLSRQRDDARVGAEEAGDHVEGRRLAGAVGPDQRMERPVAHAQVHAVHGADAAEAFLQPRHREDRPVRVRRRLEEGGQRILAGLAHRHRRVGHGLGPPAPRRALVEAHQPVGREDHERDEQQAEVEQPVLGHAREAVAEDHEEERAHRGPRNERMPPMITIASSSPENATEIGSARSCGC